MESGLKMPNTGLTDCNNRAYQEGPSPNYTQEIFEDVGRGLAEGLLDYIDQNPFSRIPLSQYKNLDSIKREIHG